MRVGKRAGSIPALKLDNLARASAVAIRGERDPAAALPRFLILLADHIQSGQRLPPEDAMRLRITGATVLKGR
jgi:hypothetical protein